MTALPGRVALVTGASRGIGRAISATLARQGARVVCGSRSEPSLNDTLAIIRAAGGECHGVVADVAREDEARRLVGEAVATFGRLDYLVNNAGDAGPTAAIERYSLEEWTATLDSCLTSTYLCARFAVAPLSEAGGGAIVNIASMAARRGLAYRVGYCAAKAGQIGLTHALAAELGPRNIRVNAILPAAVAGPRIDGVIAAQAQARGLAEDVVRRAVIERAPLGRLIEADDIAALAAFLCSDAARNISGQAIAVTAGETG
jgi:NAD(P)-dependent dehydrogenase (short-subunit alcohol dehydrogenase family)